MGGFLEWKGRSGYGQWAKGADLITGRGIISREWRVNGWVQDVSKYNGMLGEKRQVVAEPSQVHISALINIFQGAG